MQKGICPECGEPTLLAKLTCSPESGIKKNAKSEPSYLCAPHGAVDGHKTTKIVAQTTGVTIKVLCNGSLRPPEKLVH
ncbi:MAG: hypothetical protein A2845_02530 [Candidatus Lloydbacteria bacterium RIFCSPHIGHO2_01_FULL_49_22]|uniref:Uncharacterized protein n=1 Tax=Candidatus Lloydbacteria bacterium RIFCSPHIGHO2_01_FULL_49_22 TaxID=1798658 RepID=A0A1G2CVC3_9BACT|nr:MAG: hypothetical protein A2845_02530 [Candidatus Lloydbacteria bacterium RIFCSPHIGHO2_01_FULL_49_22]OGZ10324.1 MAG: hypothetical protein A3C14_02230 [Candidatus Lloydbacteria bacterium RIFCSPHIGHO2_02_FULL_50_18]